MTALLFDMDGVLVDVSRSYRKAVLETVAALSGVTVTEDIIMEYKSRGGFNNDWDLTEQILLDHNRVVDKATIIQVFQDLYLGKSFSGLIRNEIWLLEEELLQAISRDYPCGIVTGRPLLDARYVLKRFNTAAFFSVVVTMDDLPEERQKPHPMGVLTALEKLKSSKGYYFGDNVDDMQAANAAGMEAIGVIPPGAEPESHKKRLLEKGASRVLNSINDIKEVFL